MLAGLLALVGVYIFFEVVGKLYNFSKFNSVLPYDFVVMINSSCFVALHYCAQLAVQELQTPLHFGLTHLFGVVGIDLLGVGADLSLGTFRLSLFYWRNMNFYYFCLSSRDRFLSW